MKAPVSGNLLALLPESAAFSDRGITVGGFAVEDLAREYGTPLYIYDEDTVRASTRRVRAALAPLGVSITYAAKACSTPAILQILAAESVGLDTVSAGEIVLGLHAGFEPGRMYLHGNCKTDHELETAVRLSLRAVVLDNLQEIERLERICAAAETAVSVMLRLTLPFEADTHRAIQTGGPDSKFGFLHGTEEEEEAFRLLRHSPWQRLIGLHTHLGSQIVDEAIYARATGLLFALADSLAQAGIGIGEINLGGGWAVPYVPGGPELRARQIADAIGEVLLQRRSPGVTVELGRALVARAGVAVYRVGAVKRRAPRRLVAVDGGMGDNPRPALYGSPYVAVLAGRPQSTPTGLARIVGRYCESGDILADDVPLPEVAPGDHLVVPVAGAYQLSMASFYNGVPPPAAVLVGGGRHRLITRRGSIEDLLGREVLLDTAPGG